MSLFCIQVFQCSPKNLLIVGRLKFLLSGVVNQMCNPHSVAAPIMLSTAQFCSKKMVPIIVLYVHTKLNFDNDNRGNSALTREVHTGLTHYCGVRVLYYA